MSELQGERLPDSPALPESLLPPGSPTNQEFCELIDRLHQDLSAADYRLVTVQGILGEAAERARSRGILAPAKRLLAERPETATTCLIRLFLLADTLSRAEVMLALPSLTVAGALQLGIIRAAKDGGLRAALSVNPVELHAPGSHSEPLDPEQPSEALRESNVPGQSAQPRGTFEWWIVSDLDDALRNSAARHDHVMGIGGATRSLLAQLAPPSGEGRKRHTAFELGTGCGVIAMYLRSIGYQQVIASDISVRALWMAAINVRLNRIAAGIEFRLGSLFAPVAGERFDVIASNPPFVISPQQEGTAGEHGPRFEYRDGGMLGDAIAHTVVTEAPGYLREGGELIMLGNWESPWGDDGLARVRAWIEAAAESHGSLAAWVIERDRLDPIQYAETWIRDGGMRPGTDAYDTMMQAWLEDFSRRHTVAIGLGMVRLRRLPQTQHTGDTAASICVHRIERLTEPFAVDAAEAMRRVFDAGILSDTLSDEELLQQRWVVAPGVREIREHNPGDAEPTVIHLRTRAPIQRDISVDPMLAAVVGASDGELSFGQIFDALAELLQTRPDTIRTPLLAGVRELIWLGVVTPSPSID